MRTLLFQQLVRGRSPSHKNVAFQALEQFWSASRYFYGWKMSWKQRRIVCCRNFACGSQLLVGHSTWETLTCSTCRHCSTAGHLTVIPAPQFLLAHCLIGWQPVHFASSHVTMLVWGLFSEESWRELRLVFSNCAAKHEEWSLGLSANFLNHS